MITIIHGEYIALSRQFLNEQKKSVKEPVVFDGKSVTLTQIVQSLEGGGLFQEEKNIFIEDFFSRTQSKEQTDIVGFVQKNPQYHITFWEGKELSKKTLSTFKNATIESFNPPKEIFPFLENLRPGNRQSILQFHSMLKHQDVEFIYFMLVRQFRILVALIEKSDGQIDEVKRLAPWQIPRLKKQVQLFSKDQLIQNYTRLFTMDVAIKTGATPLSREALVDFFLLDL